MNIIIFGATSTTGKHLVAQAIEQGHEVSVFSRNPDNTEGEGLNRIAGDVLNPEHVRDAVAGHEAVLVALGAGGKGGVRAPGTINIIKGMQHHGVKRLICQSTLGAGESRGNLNFFWKYIMFGLLIKAAMQDHEEQEQAVRNSNLDWVIIRPAAFTDGPLTGEYLHGFSPTQRTQLKISRADVAHFMLAQLQNPAYRHQCPGLSY